MLSNGTGAIEEDGPGGQGAASKAVREKTNKSNAISGAGFGWNGERE